ncbi:MAG: amidohydrolase family protein, partial [Myxococcota bacterium]
SGNLVGGRAVTLKLRRRPEVGSMRFRGAPPGLKMACGENPKRVYGERKKMPMSRMGNLKVQRQAFLDAKTLMGEWARWATEEGERRAAAAQARAALEAKRNERAQQKADCREGKADPKQCRKWASTWATEPLVPPSEAELPPPKRNLDLETLAGAMTGHVLVHIHCYRADDMARMMALADEMGFRVRSFHHALEAYKIRDTLAARDISVSTWADWWGFKMEAYDGIQENLALVFDAGARAIVHSDSEEGIRRLNQEAAKGMWAGRHQGIEISDAEAAKWITLNPAWALGIDARVGSLTVGKDADVVVWDRADPFSVYARAERVYVDGHLALDRNRPSAPWSDFEADPSEVPRPDATAVGDRAPSPPPSSPSSAPRMSTP